MLSEPIFGQETIIEGEPLVITEGMADAITAHDNGIPSISPVTTKFDAENFEVLKDIIEEYNIPRVSIAPDADPSPYTVENKYTQEYRENYNENKDRNEDGEVSTEEPVVFDGDKTDAEALEEALTYHEFGPGLRGAAQTGRKLDKAATNEITATDGANPLPKDEIDSDADESYADVPQPYRQHYIAASEPPRHEPAHTPDRSFRTRIIQVDNTLYTKYDFDDYINANYHHYCPPSNWIKNDLIEQNIQASWVKDLLEAEDIEYPTLEEHDAINSGDNDYLKPEWITRLAAEGIAVEGLKIAPPLATVRNYTQTLAPGDIPTPAEASKNSMEKAREKSRPSKINLNSGGNKLFNLSIRDVLGIREGFRGKSPFGHIGDSENYFCVIDEQIAYCHKRDATYNPITSILVLAGERKKTAPRGRMTPREKFKAWEYARKNNIVEAQIPNEGLIYYAKKRGIATADDVQTKESDGGSKYESLDNRSYYQAIEKLTEEYNFNILRDTYEEKQASNDEKAGSQESKKDNQTDRSKNTSTQQNDSTTESESEPESKKSARTTHATNTTDDANKQAENNLAEDVDGGVSLSEIDEDLAASVSDSSSESSETNGETSSEDQETNDGTTRFQTYTPPAEDDEDVDIDRHAVKQFVEEFANVDPDAGSNLIVPKTKMMDAFIKWAKINNIELNKLSQSSAMNIRKGKLKSSLEEEYGITTGRPSINGERTRCFKCIELSDSIEELLEE